MRLLSGAASRRRAHQPYISPSSSPTVRRMLTPHAYTLAHRSARPPRANPDEAERTLQLAASTPTLKVRSASRPCSAPAQSHCTRSAACGGAGEGAVGAKLSAEGGNGGVAKVFGARGEGEPLLRWRAGASSRASPISQKASITVLHALVELQHRMEAALFAAV